jgi:mRNA interferase MazF
MKRRPALVVADLPGDDAVLCQITTQAAGDRIAVSLDAADFETGGLSRSCTIRPSRLFTADSHIIMYAAGHVHDAKPSEVLAATVGLFRSP